MPDREGHDLLRDWQRAMQSLMSSAKSLPGRAELPRQLIEPMERQLELVEELIERERRFQRDVAGRLAAPVDAVFDLLEESAVTLRKQAEALAAAGRALDDTAGLVANQAELFEKTVATLREPAELAKAVAGVERRPRRRAPSKPRRS